MGGKERKMAYKWKPSKEQRQAFAEIYDDEVDDLPGGLTLAISGDQTLGNFTWLDDQPDQDELVKICKTASAALEEYDFRADRRGETWNRMDKNL